MASTAKIMTSEMRKRNRHRIYTYLYSQDQPKTKRDIEEKLHLSMPTITQDLKELLAQQLIGYVGMEESTGGRKPRQLAVNPSARFAVGVEIAPRFIRYAAIDLRACEIAYSIIPAEFHDGSVFFPLLSDQLEIFLDEYALNRERLLGIGIAMPCLVDEATGMITTAPALGISRMQFHVNRITEAIPYCCSVQSSASASGAAEWQRDGHTQNLAYLHLGKDVGGAIFVNKTPYRGQHGRSAEFGHTCIVPGGKPCQCGKRGCLEAYCSTARLTNDLGKTTKAFFDGLNAGNAECLNVWKTYLDYLALGIYNIRMILDCDIMLGGVISPFLSEYLPDLSIRLQRLNAFERSASYLHVGKCGNKASCTGAALRFIQEFVESI